VVSVVEASALSTCDFWVAGFVRIQEGSEVPIKDGLFRSLTTSAMRELPVVSI